MQTAKPTNEQVDEITMLTYLYLCKIVADDGKPERLERKRESAKRYRTKNKEKIAAQRKRYKEKHRDKVNADKRKYRERNKDTINKYNNNYRINNKEKYNAYNRKHRAKKKAEREIKLQEIDNFTID